MGISISVESIYPPPSRRIGPIGYAKKAALNYIEEINKAFNWETLPWEDPVEYIGIDTSANYSKYALALEAAEGTLIRDEEELSKLPFDTLTWDERFERFRHFLDRDEYVNFYIPVDFHPPKHLENSFSEMSFVVASSVRLAREMQDLQREISYFVEKYPNDKIRENSHTWLDLSVFYFVLYFACKESIEVNLPVQLLY